MQMDAASSQRRPPLVCISADCYPSTLSPADVAVVTALLSATGVLAAETVQLPLEVTPVGKATSMVFNFPMDEVMDA